MTGPHAWALGPDPYSPAAIRWRQAVREERERAAAPLSCSPRQSEGGGVVPKARLPGSGQLGKGCGELVPVGVCASCGEAPATLRRCYGRLCPSCGKGPDSRWADRESRRATELIVDYLGLYPKGALAPVRQVILSPPPDRWRQGYTDGECIAALRDVGRRLMERYSWGGKSWGCMVVHLWRGCMEEGYNRWGPHVHILGPGVDVREAFVWAMNLGRGWVVKQATSWGGRFVDYARTPAKLRRHIRYELGHAAVIGQGHALVWFGAIRSFAESYEDGDPGADGLDTLLALCFNSPRRHGVTSRGYVCDLELLPCHMWHGPPPKVYRSSMWEAILGDEVER